MGLTHIEVSVINPARRRLKFLVDSGALYSVVPAPILRRLGIKPGKTKTFILADCTEIRRSVGEARCRLNVEEARLRSSSARKVIAFCWAVFRWRFWASFWIPSSANYDIANALGFAGGAWEHGHEDRTPKDLRPFEVGTRRSRLEMAERPMRA